MYSIKGQECFDSAHFLRGHEGKCKNLHGHRWMVQYEIEAETLISEGSSEGMLIDFGDIKSHVKNLIDTYDHAFIYEPTTSDVEYRFISACKEMNFDLVEVDFRPTAENFSQYFFIQIDKILQNLVTQGIASKGIRVKDVTVYETPNNSASYRGEVNR